MENVGIKSVERLKIFNTSIVLAKIIVLTWWTRSTGNLSSSTIILSMNDYFRFYISFENAICKDYITEKTFNALKLNTIPIVLGGVNYTSVLPPGSFINAAEFVSPQGGVPSNLTRLTSIFVQGWQTTCISYNKIMICSWNIFIGEGTTMFTGIGGVSCKLPIVCTF